MVVQEGETVVVGADHHARNVAGEIFRIVPLLHLSALRLDLVKVDGVEGHCVLLPGFILRKQVQIGHIPPLQSFLL